MAPEHIEDGGINVTQQKTGKELWVPLHADLRDELEAWNGSPFVKTPKGESYTPRPLPRRMDAADERHSCRED